MNETKIYLPGLNGLRAFAALSVVIAHLSLKGIADFGLPVVDDIPMAGFGVTLFFVISGFLITYLLLKELNKQSNIDIKKFYARRILRIWPIYYLFIIICLCVLILLGKQHEILSNEMWYYLFFTANIPFILQQGIFILLHYWSIGVEEQFYLFWPWIVLKSRNKLLKITVVIFLLLFVTKLLFWWYFGSSSYEYRFISVTRFHCMMVGAIGAILYFKNQIGFKNLFSNKTTQIVSWLLFILMGFNIIYIPAVIAHEVISVASLSMIMGQIILHNRIFNLENRLFDFIGKISYSIYIIHPLIIFLLSGFFKELNIEKNLKFVLVYSSVIVVTIFIAWLSYTFFEKPFLKLKVKFAVVESSNSMLS